MLNFKCTRNLYKMGGETILNTQLVLSRNIRMLIQERGLKQKAVANKCNISEKAFSNMLCNRQTINTEILAVIAGFLEVSIDDLFKTDSKE